MCGFGIFLEFKLNAMTIEIMVETDGMKSAGSDQYFDEVIEEFVF